MAADSPKSLPLEFLQTRPKVIAAFGNDDAGNEMAQAIKQMLPQTIVVRPVAVRNCKQERFKPQTSQN